jgi:tetratricopeptide (TPR) repeat protein
LLYYQKALQVAKNIAKKQPNTTLVVQSFNYISKVYQKKGDYKKSVEFAQEGLQIKSIKQTEPEIYCYLINNLGYSQFKQGDLGAENLFRETLKMAINLKNIPIQITSKTYLAELLIAKNDNLHALIYLRSAQVQAHENQIFDDEIEILKLSIGANPSKKYLYSKRLFELSDSLQVVERNTREKFARIAYETKEISQQKKIVEVKNQYLVGSNGGNICNIFDLFIKQK